MRACTHGRAELQPNHPLRTLSEVTHPDQGGKKLVKVVRRPQSYGPRDLRCKLGIVASFIDFPCEKPSALQGMIGGEA